MSDPNRFQRLMGGLKEGAKKSAEATRLANEYYPSVLNIAGKYHEELKKQGVSLRETPVQAAGAFGARLITDLTNDGTRGVYWRYNHPLAILDKAVDKTIESAVGKEAYQSLGKTKTGLIAATAAIPATALAGTYDITNVGQLFRPKGYAQSYAEEGSEDRRETSQPSMELFERFFLGRQGRPLKYETAKQDIPDLTPERYGNFMRNYYQDKGLLGLVKYTPENLEGVPELRMLGYPVNVASASTAVGGLAGISAALRTTPQGKSLTKRGIAGGAIGAAVGGAMGTLINNAIAQGNRPKLPTVAEYTQEMQ